MTPQINSLSPIPLQAVLDENAQNGPWHAGEVHMQKLAGVDVRMAEIGTRVIRDHLIEQHRNFYPQLPFAVFGTVDNDGNPWATLRANHPGFLHAPNPYQLDVALPRENADPADAGMDDGKSIGMIGIELHTRRRNRLNGKIMALPDNRFAIRVGHSYGNCPQYIRLRQFEFTRDPMVPSAIAPQETDHLDANARQIIANADTFFVATYVDTTNGERQIDVSHRGGKAGFVHIDADGTLTIPDFAGNLFFNTLGNILTNGRAGLIFPDFATGNLLQITGRADVIVEGPEIAAFQGAERLWRVFPQKVVYRQSALPLRWANEEDGVSPSSLLTGNWDDAQKSIRAARAAQQWRPFRVTRIVEENHLIRSFYLEPADGDGILPHKPGQHLPIRVNIAGHDAPVIRTYTLSNAASDGIYRISVKRDGVVSGHLHSNIKPGAIIEARAPSGDFHLGTDSERPAVFLAGGIGITPMLAMIRHLAYEGKRTRNFRPAWLFYAARNLADRAFDDEIVETLTAAQGYIRLIRVLGDTDGAVPRQDYEASGYIDMDLLRGVLPFDDYDFYMCGPPPFMQSLYDGLRDMNIANTRIHAEAFGPASLKRSSDAQTAEAPLPPMAETATDVQFAQSGQTAQWQPDSGQTLLELAEQAGLSPEFSCRGGSCGTCRTKILQGSVTYATRPDASVAADEALICCAMPTATDNADASANNAPLILDL